MICPTPTPGPCFLEKEACGVECGRCVAVYVAENVQNSKVDVKVVLNICFEGKLIGFALSVATSSFSSSSLSYTSIHKD